MAACMTTAAASRSMFLCISFNCNRSASRSSVSCHTIAPLGVAATPGDLRSASLSLPVSASTWARRRATVCSSIVSERHFTSTPLSSALMAASSVFAERSAASAATLATIAPPTASPSADAPSPFTLALTSRATPRIPSTSFCKATTSWPAIVQDCSLLFSCIASSSDTLVTMTCSSCTAASSLLRLAEKARTLRKAASRSSR
mmetsp:Transcript_64731/g.115070  ORF Transcript_64731/g.115070 Transcript_64731/m.115070 type:complete len:203 (-) Transcript_64731:872-1480(-)